MPNPAPSTPPVSRSMHTLYCIDGRPVAALFDRGLFISGFSLREGRGTHPGSLPDTPHSGTGCKDRLAREIEADLRLRFGDRLVASRQRPVPETSPAAAAPNGDT